MDNADEISKEIVFSGALDFVVGAPPVDERVSDLLDSDFETAARATVCLTSKGGTKRETIKPTIKKFGDATEIDVGDALQEIAWSHCSRAGVSGRYCVEVFPRDAKGRVSTTPRRAYFDLSPDGDAPEIEGNPDGPTPSYVRALERTNERTLRILQETARAVVRRDEQYHRDRITTKAVEGQTKVDLARVAVEQIAVESAGRRKDTIFNAAASMLPKAAMKALEKWGSDDEKAPDKTLPPGERIKAFLDADELKALVSVLGDERWSKLEKAKTIKECREILGSFTEADAAAVVAAGLPVDKLTEIASWEDAAGEVVEAPKEEAAAQ